MDGSELETGMKMARVFSKIFSRLFSQVVVLVVFTKREGNVKFELGAYEPRDSCVC